MNFDLSDEQKMLAEQARGLLTERVPFDRLRGLINASSVRCLARKPSPCRPPIDASRIVGRPCLREGVSGAALSISGLPRGKASA